MDIDIDRVEVERSFGSEGELHSEVQSDAQSDIYNGSGGVGSVDEDTDSTTNSNDSYEEADDEAIASVSSYNTVEDEDTPSKALELGIEAQL